MNKRYVMTVLGCTIILGGWVVARQTNGLQEQPPPVPAPQPSTGTATGSSQPAASSAGAVTFKPVIKTHDLMEGQDLHFKTMSDLIKSNVTPGKIIVHASVLAELANVNTLMKDKDDYRQWAAQVRDLALGMAEEARKRKNADMNELKAMLGKIEATCTACHDAYN